MSRKYWSLNMPTHNEKDPERSIWQQPEEHGPDEIDVAAGYEKSDVRVTGIVVFLTALGIFVAVTGVLCYGIGMVINAQLDKQDGPTTKWTKTVQIRQLGNLPNNPEMQKKMAELAQTFPSPRLQEDDGMQEMVDLHGREDLLLENYSWVDQSQGKVRIPIERAMELIAAQGLPVAPAANQASLMTGDAKQGVVTEPLTNGFARTGYEQDEAQAEAIAERRK
jgi:hypothetical protein